jgi:hypothetical protein
MGTTDICETCNSKGYGRCVCENAPSSCTVDSIVVPRVLWERTVKVVERIQNSKQRQMGALPPYCPSPMNRHDIDNLMNEIRRHNARGANQKETKL